MTVTSDKTLFQSVIHMVDSLSADGNYDAIIHILSLLCLFSVLNRPAVNQPSAIPLATGQSAAAGNPLQKLLGDLMKGGGATAGGGGGSPLSGALGAALGSPDLLMSLLPLLNNPQIKSKINPANIASVMGIINNMGGLGGLAGLANLGGNAAAGGAAPGNEKNEDAKPKPEKKTPDEEASPPIPINTPAPASAPPPPEEVVDEKKPVPTPELKPANRFLKWKTNF